MLQLDLHSMRIESQLLDILLALGTVFCRFKTLGTYITWQLLLSEWNEGIVFGACPNKRTVPLKDLEKDFSEGKQKGSAQNPPTCQTPWRKIEGRNAIRDRKIIIYAALGAQLAGEDASAVMNALQQEAQQAVDKTTGPGNAATLMTFMKRKIEAMPGFLSPIEFERQILKWKHTPQLLAQANSKHQATKETTPYPPQSIASRFVLTALMMMTCCCLFVFLRQMCGPLL